MKKPTNSHDKGHSEQAHDCAVTHTLDHELDHITEMASLICRVPISILYIKDIFDYKIKSNYGIDPNKTITDTSFCHFTMIQDKILEVNDATLDGRFKNNPLVTGPPFIRFYAGCSLYDTTGDSMGVISVMDNKPFKLDLYQKKALKLLARQIIGLVKFQIKIDELSCIEKLLELSQDLACVFTADGHYKRISPPFEKVLGWNKKFLMNTNFFDLIHPDDLEKMHSRIGALIAGDTPINAESRMRCKNGAYLSLRWVIMQEPATGTLFAIAYHITEERLQGEKLRISENKFRSFFENSQGALCTHDLDGNLLSINFAGAKLLGYQADEILQFNLFELVPPKYHAELKNYLDQIQQQGKASGLLTFNHKDGSQKIMSFNNILIRNECAADYVVGNSIDVTQSHQLEVSLRKTRQMLLDTNEMARVGGWEINLVEQKVYWSEVTRQILCVEPDFQPECPTTCSFFKPGKNSQKISDAASKAISDGLGYDLELELVTATGEELWVRVIGNAEFKNGICTRLYGTFQDIDQRKRVELEVLNAKKLLDGVMDAASEVCIISTNTDGIITVFNRGAQKLLGYSADEMIGKQHPGIIHVEWEIKERAKQLSHQYDMPIDLSRVFVHIAELEGSEIREWTYKTKEGLLVPVSLVMTTIRDSQGTITGYVGVAMDLSTRKKAEQRLADEKARLLAFVKHTPAAVAMLDTENRYLAVSNRWLEKYNLNSQHIMGQHYNEVFPYSDQPWDEITSRCLNGEIVAKEEDVWQRPGQEPMYVKWEVRPWYYLDQSVGGTMIFTQNITENVLRNEQLKQATILAEQASQAKSEFLSNMSHEIRTPLNGVIGFSDLLLKTNMADPQKEYLSIINQSATTLLGIVNNILDFSKIEAGKLELDIDKYDIYEIAGQAVDMISFQLQNKNLEILLNLQVDLPRFVWVDQIRLAQVLNNLLSNAAKFTDNGEIELRIEILDNPYGLNELLTCRFQVRDTGIGIRKDKQDKVFEAFFQEDSSLTKKYGGTGLGLAVSNKLLGIMGSRLQLDSKQGEGSTFFFDLSMKYQTEKPSLLKNGPIKKALIVDDNEANRQILAGMLNTLNIDSDQARDGADALEILASDVHYDIVFMDHQMPQMNGLETIRQIKGRFSSVVSDIPIIILDNSRDEPALSKHIHELRVSGRLLKPVKLAELILSIAALSKTERSASPVRSGDNDPTANVLNNTLVILIAEDNPVNMFLIKMIISNIVPNGHIYQATNGLQAVELFKNKLPDIIFMDIQMPEMNGHEATRVIRNLPQGTTVPIIAVSAGNEKGAREKCFEAGMNEFISKPYVKDDIWQAINKFLVLH